VTVYSRFGSKQQLLARVIARESAELLSSLLTAYEIDPKRSLPERLHEYVLAYFTYGRERPDAFRLLFSDTLGSGFKQVIDTITERISELVAHEDGHAVPGPGHRLIAPVIVGAVHHGAGAAAASGDIDTVTAAIITKRFLSMGAQMKRPAEHPRHEHHRR
jgi:AcrR family transcriptional regulator